MLSRLRRGGQLPVSEVSIEKAAGEWLHSYVPSARSTFNVKMAEGRIRLHLVPLMGWMLVGRVTGDDVRRYRQALEKRDLAPRSIKHLLSELRCLLNWCVDAGYIPKSPFPKKVMPRIQETPPDRLTDEEAELVMHLPDPWGFVCRLAIGSGLRWGELTRVNRSDLVGSCLVVHHTKSTRLRRVPLDHELGLLREVQHRLGPMVPFSVRSSGAFATQVKKRSGVRGFHAHQMRHTFACRWIERGGSLAALQQMLGHSTVVMTQRYARLSDEAVRAESQRLARI